MKSKILITGGGGFLGGRLALYYQDKFEVKAVSHRELDIRQEDEVRAFLEREKPDVLLHCAAISNTGTCEKNPELSKEINLTGAVITAKACKENGCKMVFMSSDQIYCGSRHLLPNKETDEVSPVNVYGRHKKQAEDGILEIIPDAVCLRLPWMYDFPVRGLKINRNFLCNAIKSAVRNQPVELPLHDYREITWVQEVVSHMEEAMKLPGGIYNFSGTGSDSVYELGRHLLNLLGREDLALPEYTRFASQPRNLTMDTEKLNRAGIIFPDTKQGFSRCFDSCPEYTESLIQ